MPIVLTLLIILVILYIVLKVVDEWIGTIYATDMLELLFRWTNNRTTTMVVVMLLIAFRVLYEIGGLFARAAV